MEVASHGAVRALGVVILVVALASGQSAGATPVRASWPGMRLQRTVRVATLRAWATAGRLFAPLVGYAELYTPWRYGVERARHRVSRVVTRGSRPEGNDVAELHRRGYRAIVALTAEAVDDEAKAKALGMRFLRIPIIDNTVPTVDQMKQFLDFVTDPGLQPRGGGGPTVYVHCQKGHGRTGIAIAVYRIAVEGWDVGRAVVEAREHGLVLHHQVEFIRHFARELRAGRVPGYGKLKS